MRSSRRRRSRPCLQALTLEDRLAPALVTWTNPNGGDWNLGGNWDAGHAPFGGDDVLISGLNSGKFVTHPSGTDTVGALTLLGNLTLAGGSLAVTGNSTTNQTLTVQAGATLSFTSGATMNAQEAYPGAAFGIIVNGNMNAIGTSFTRSGSLSYMGSNIQVNAGGHLTASNSTFGWAGLSLATGSILNTGEITGNTFDQNITIPASDAALLANNLSFKDIYIQPGSISAGQTVTLSPLGTVSTVNQHYIFNAATGNFNVQAGGTLNVTAGTAMVAQEAYPGSAYGIVVNGSMYTTGAVFSRSGSTSYAGSFIQVNAGGHLFASSNMCAWAALTLATGSILNNGDITGNTFNQSITIPAADATLLANNLSFQDVYILPGSISAGQTVTLSPLGIMTTANQHYVFNAATANLTVQAGGTLNVTAGTSMVAQEAYPGSAYGIVVNGTMYATGAAFSRSGSTSYTGSFIQVNAGGHLFATNNTFAWASLVLANGSILNTGDITGNQFNQNITIPASDATLLANNLNFQDVYIQPGSIGGGQSVTLAPLGTVTNVNQHYIFNAATGNFTVQAGGTLIVAPGTSMVAQEAYPGTGYGIVVSGTMYATGAAFSRSGSTSYTGSIIQVNSGGHLFATNNTIAWASLVLANGSILNNGDITGNQFNQDITIPAKDAVLLANNQIFQDVYILPGSIPSGQSVTLSPLGTVTSVNQHYIFNAATGNFNVQAGGTLIVTPGTALIAQEAYPGTGYGIVVYGTMYATGATFSRSGSTSYTGSNLQVNSGGHLFATNNTFGWAGLTLANGSILNTGDITGNTFNQNITIPAIDATLLADNLLFQDIYIQPGTIGSGQTATLAPLGTVTSVNQHYVFNASLGNLTVQAGGTLNVTKGTAMIAQEAYPGTVFGIFVSGAMNIAGAVFSRSGSTSYIGSTLQINSGGSLTAISSTLGWANLNLSSGSTDKLQFVGVANSMTINSGATIDIAFNDFSNIVANGVVAVGVSTATIDLSDNFWGTTVASEIAAKILDHVDNSTRPTVLYTPSLNEPVTSFFDPSGLQIATAGHFYSQTLTAVPGTGPADNFTVTNGSLPAGLSLSTTGVLSGTPTATGAYTLTISADDSNISTGFFTANQVYWLYVNAPVIAFNPSTLPATRTGVSYNQMLTGTGGTAPYSQFVVSAGAMPNGLTLALDGTISGTPTTVGTFNFAVTARDSTTGLAAPYTGTRNYAIVVDDTPPTVGTASDGPGADIDFQGSTTTIAANWAGFADLESGIASYLWAIGTTPGGTDVQGYTSVGNVASISASGLSLISGTKYFLSVEAVDYSGNVSNPATSDGVSVDATPPTPGTVSDGAAADIDIQGSQSTINANWNGFSDSGSGIASYRWAIGSTPGGSDVQAFINVGTATSASASGLSLVRGTTYYVSVTATDNIGNVSVPASSDGVAVVTPAPIITGFSVDSGIVGDGITNDNTPTLAGTAEVGSIIQVYDGGNSIGSTATDIVGFWQYTTAVLPNVSHNFTATATDIGNHTSPPSAPLVVTVDTSLPTVTIDQAGSQTEPTNALSVKFSVHFSEPVTGFTESDIDLAGSTVTGSAVQSVTGSGTDYTVTVVGMAGEGNVVASIPAGAAIDVAGNGNTVSTSTDNSIVFDNVAPTVTISKDATQADPTAAGPITFKVHFSEPVTGFSEAGVNLSGGFTGLSKSFTGSGTDYTVQVTGMFGAGDVIASILAGAASDATGNASLATTQDASVHFNHVGVLQFNVSTFDTFEGDTNATVWVERLNGGDGPTSVSYSTVAGTATSSVDYTLTSGTLSWIDGDTAPKSITVPIPADLASVNEGRESFTLTLSSPMDGAVLGSPATVTFTIAKSNGATINAIDKSPQVTITDSDGDLITIKLAGKLGSLTYYETNGSGPIAEIDLSATDSSKSVVSVTVKKPKGGGGDGRTTIGEIDGTGVKSLALATADLDGLAGDGIQLTSFLGALSIGAIKYGADITLAGAAPKPGLGTKITAGVIGDGTDIAITDAPLASLTAISVGVGTIAAPSVGAINIKGKAKTKTAAAIAGDFKSNLTIAGTGLPAKAVALKSFKVAGTVSGSSIAVGSLAGTIGDVGSVSVGSFINSHLYAGYDIINGFNLNLASTIGSFTVTGKNNAFSDGFVIAAKFKNVVLASVDQFVDNTKFGFVYDTWMKALIVKSPKFKFNTKGTPTQDMDGSDFQVKKA